MYMEFRKKMFKLVLEKAVEPEIKLPTSAGSSKKQESSRKASPSAIDYTKALHCVDHIKLWKILKEKRIPEATGKTGHGTVNCFQSGKGVHQSCILSPAYLTYMQSTS